MPPIPTIHPVENYEVRITTGRADLHMCNLADSSLGANSAIRHLFTYRLIILDSG